MIKISRVKCKYCGETFEKNDGVFVQIPWGSKFRYAHEKCYKQAKANNTETKTYEIVDPNAQVQCYYCNRYLDKSKESYIMVMKTHYAHTACAINATQRSKTPEEQLDEYIIELFNLEYVTPLIRNQIKKYKTENGYTITGILSTLKYYYEVQHHSPEGRETLGIVPYVYDAAKEYYYKLWMTNELNKKAIQSYSPKEITVTITPKKREPLKKRKFTFLEKDELVNE